MINLKIKLRIHLKFVEKFKKKNLNKCFKSLKEVFGDNCNSDSQIFEWHKLFLEDWDVVEEDGLSNKPVTSRIGHVHRFCSILMASSLPQDENVKHQYYIEVLRKLIERVRQKYQICRTTAGGFCTMATPDAHCVLRKTVVFGQTH
ncbi:hypothetical protein TNCV_3571551 [Trichonephila clavipes]|nr:hypothetical protein TNCV_3571551 [Trichonephila clavipes]